MNNITLDPITKKFTQVIPPERVCYICSGNKKYVDDHHYDLEHGKISDETIPLCRRCHKTIHMNGGINMFEDDLLDKAIEVFNKTQALLNRPLMIKENIRRSKYWLKKHGVKKAIVFDPTTKRFIQEGTSVEDESGSQTAIFPFQFPRGEPLCGWDWVNEHLYDLLDYVPRIEIIGPNIDLAMEIKSLKDLREVGKALRGLKGNKRKVEEVITLDPVTKRFSNEGGI